MWRWISGRRGVARRYQRTLMAAASGMTRIRELPRLCRLIVYIVNRAVGLTNSALFLYHAGRRRYELAAVRYPHLLPKELTLDAGHAAVEVLKRQQGLVVRQRLPRSDQWALADRWMEELEWSLLVPSFSSDRLLGFLALGAKRSGRPYATDDLELFSTLTNQGTLGIENATFFEELKANEAYLLQAEKLATLGHLATGVAHELHNPLTIISGEAQLYLERFKGKDPAVDALLSSIIEEAHRAAEMGRRVMRFARPAPGSEGIGAVDVRAVFTESLHLADYQVRVHRLERHVAFPEGLPCVRGNATQLQEVFLSLLLHASESMPEPGGRLDVAAGVVEGEVEVRFTHSGETIPPRKLAQLFDPFAGATEGAGSAAAAGLRLFVSQRIIQAYGGRLIARSAEGQGTIFTIRLPTAQASASSSSLVSR